jgi:hypothetical protein
MFTAIGVSVIRAGAKYDITVDYFDDRTTPMKLVSTVTHNVNTQAELTTAVNAQLDSLRLADRVQTLNTAIAGKVLGTV